jgi:lipocalin
LPKKVLATVGCATVAGDNTVQRFQEDHQQRDKKRQRNYKGFVSSPDEGKLKLSFFGLFYSGYGMIAKDAIYKHALAAGKRGRRVEDKS